MPANLPPQYYELEREFNKESDPTEKLRLAKELLALMPKHKGTDKLQAELKAKIARLKKESETGGKKHGAHRIDTHSHIEKEGAAQAILIGPPNSGKSSLLESLTNAKPLIADFPFTTREPLAGMMKFETVQIQLIDTPPISDDLMPPYLPNLIRQADLIIVVCDISQFETVHCLESLSRKLEEKGILLAPGKAQKVENPRYVVKKAIINAHKYLENGWDSVLSEVVSKYPGFTVIPTSIIDDDSILRFKAAIFGALDIIRIFTKRVGHEPEFYDPIVIPSGGTVEDAARLLHKDFAEKFQFAKIWGKGKFEGQRVKNNFILSDGDIIEFHI
jgi:ribosome-interacting GTPase 1